MFSQLLLLESISPRMKVFRPETDCMTKSQALSLSEWVFESIGFQIQGRWEVGVDLCIGVREEMVKMRSLDCDSCTDDRWEVVESCEDGFFEFLRHV